MRVLPDEFNASIWTGVYPAFSTDTLIEAACEADKIVAGTAGVARLMPMHFDRYEAHTLLAQHCRAAINALAPRHREVLTALVAGYSNKQIARLLGLSPRTVEVYRAAMMSRLHVATLAQSLYIAFMAGMVPSDAASLGAD